MTVKVEVYEGYSIFYSTPNTPIVGMVVRDIARLTGCHIVPERGGRWVVEDERSAMIMWTSFHEVGVSVSVTDYRRRVSADEMSLAVAQAMTWPQDFRN